jgi:hypothetical protein
MHLELVIHMFNQKLFTLQNFHFGIAVQNWKDNKIWYGARVQALTATNLQVVFSFVSFLIPIFLKFLTFV